TTYRYDQQENSDRYSSQVVTIDVSDPQAPVLAGDIELDFSPSYGFGHTYGMATSGQPVVGFASALAFAQQEYEYDDNGNRESTLFAVNIVNLSDPAAPVVEVVELPKMVGATGLLLSGQTLALSHFESADNDDTGKVRFYVDRIDVSDPQNPVALP